MIGKTIGQYEITAELGQGGMGVVYLATDTKIGRTVALKFLPEYLARGDEAKTRFLREAHTAGQLDHPNICTIHDIAETPEGQMYLVMAYYPGGSLEERMEAGDLDEDEVLGIIGQIASGLDAAHAAGIVHRDIKPANILFSADGLVKIVDFGLAKLSDQTRVTLTGTTLGTGSYMAPEQASGEEAGPAADIWSLTVVAYEMLTGEKPFQADFFPAVIYAIVNTEPRTPSSVNSRLTAQIDVALAKGLSKDPADRFARAEELREALTAPELVPAAKTGRVRRLTGSTRTTVARRTPGLRLGLVVLAVLVGAAGYVGWTQLRDAESLPSLPPGPSSSRTLAILPFFYRGDEADRDLAAHLPQMLADRLSFKGDLHVAVGDTLAPFLSAAEKKARQETNLEATAGRLDADLVMTGTVTVTGGNLQVLLRIGRSEGAATRIAGPVQPVGEILAYADHLTIKCIPSLYPEPWAESIRMQASVTDDWQALSHFIAAELDRRLLDVANWRKDADAALQADSTLALAHLNKVHLAFWIEDEQLAIEETHAAARHAAQLPPEGRDLIEAGNLFLENKMDQAESLLKRTLLTRPDFLDAWLALGYIGWDSNPLRGKNLLETRPYFEEALKLDPRMAGPQIIMPFLWTIAGEYRSLERHYTRTGGQGIAPRDQALLAFLTEDDSRQEALADSLDLTRIFIQQAMVLNWPDNFASKLRYLQHLHDHIENPLLQGWAQEIMAQIRAGLGQWDQARRDFAALPEKQQPWRLTYESLLMAMPFTECTPAAIRDQIARLEAWHPRITASLEEDSFGLVGSRYNPDYAIHPHMKELSLGMLQMRLGDLAAARQALHRLGALGVESRSQPMVKELALSLEAWIVYQEGNPQGALDVLADAAQYSLMDMGYSGLHDRPFQRYLRALALVDVGRLDEAIPWLANINQKSERNMAYVVPAYRRLGEIYAQRGDTAAALEYYRKFLRWTANADKNYRPRREEVASRVAELSSP